MRKFNASEFIRELNAQGKSSYQIEVDTGISQPTIRDMRDNKRGKLGERETVIRALIEPYGYVLCIAHESELQGATHNGL